MGPVLFADTAFLVALLWPRDPLHHRAAEWQLYFRAQKLGIVTTQAVLWELLNAFSGVANRQNAYRAYTSLHREPRVEVVEFSAELQAGALQLYSRRPDKEWSLTDCLSFVVMEQRDMTDALTSDHHFAQAGFRVLLPDAPPK